MRHLRLVLVTLSYDYFNKYNYVRYKNMYNMNKYEQIYNNMYDHFLSKLSMICMRVFYFVSTKKK